MVFKHFVLIAVAALAAAGDSSRPPSIAPDRYGVAAGAVRIPNTEATVQIPQVNSHEGMEKRSWGEKVPPPPKEAVIRIRDRRAVKDSVQKRSYSGWSRIQTVEFPDYEPISQYKPPVYQLSRPYYIPVFGSSGRIPIYFPPQQFAFNSGPVKNKPSTKRPYVGPTYLPPYPETTTTKVVVMDRFNNEYDDEDGPIWDSVPARTPQDVQNSVSDNIIPTRAPKGSASPPPPIQHRPSTTQTGKNNVQLAALDEDDVHLSPNDLLVPPKAEFLPQRPSTTKPPPPPRSTTSRPSTESSAGPSNCVWAIVSCCSAASRDAPEKCFEQRGCSGPFWGTSPCDSDFARAAIERAVNYYNA